MTHYLDFEKPVAELEGKLRELRHISGRGNEMNISDEINNLEKKVQKILQQIYIKLTPQQKVKVARHPDRPHAVDYIGALITDFEILAGDRYYSEDAAIIAGIGRFEGQSVAIIGQEKGHDVESRLKHNFGMPRPEGYRKAIRIMDLADRFNLPVLSFVDTAGAYPGVGAEERGQAEAIAQSIDKCLSLSVPIISAVIGEGGSGGAMAIAAANHVMMLEHAVYSVISPEGCASILWRDETKAETAAEALKITAQDLKSLKIIDQIIDEPLGGAHRDRQALYQRMHLALSGSLKELQGQDGTTLKASRADKFIQMGRI